MKYRPYCINEECKQCDPSAGFHMARCMCSAGEYCVSDPSDVNNNI